MVLVLIFAFLTVLILALGFWRPDLLYKPLCLLAGTWPRCSASCWWRWRWGVGLAGWLVWRKGRLASLRQRDGAFPIQRVKLRDGRCSTTRTSRLGRRRLCTRSTG